MPTRRDVLTGLAAVALTARPLGAAAPLDLRAAAGRAQLAPEGYAPTPVWCFDGTVPGPEIRLPQGARLVRRLVNDLPVPTSVHWHGIRIDNAMDGVSGLTQEPVPPGGSFLYDFALPDAGTYWYHSHTSSMEQVDRGLAAPLIVEEAEGPDVDADLVLMLDDWRLDPETVEIAPFGNLHDLSHGGRFGNLVTVNGRFESRTPTRSGARLRLRLVNAANARIFACALQGMEGWIVALDGMPLETPELVAAPLTLAPAQRVDLIVDVTAETGSEAGLVSVERDGAYMLAAFPVQGSAARTRRPAPAALPPNPVPAAGDPAAAPLTTVRMRGLPSAEHEGVRLEPRELMERGLFWALSGTAGRPERPILDAARGEVHRLALVNDTAFPHGMHLHGHHFRALGPDGTPGPLRDTLLVEAGQTQQVVFVADNPGKWLLHCHMLGHALAGMTTWLRVS